MITLKWIPFYSTSKIHIQTHKYLLAESAFTSNWFLSSMNENYFDSSFNIRNWISLSFHNFFTEHILEEGTSLIIESPHYPLPSTNNSYHLWVVQAPAGFLVSIFFEHIETHSAWDGYSYIYYGENTSEFSDLDIEDCPSWIRLTDNEGQFRDMYGNFVSRTSSVKIIFFGVTTRRTFSIRLQAFQPKGEGIIWKSLDFHMFVGLIPCSCSHNDPTSLFKRIYA